MQLYGNVYGKNSNWQTKYIFKQQIKSLGRAGIYAAPVVKVNAFKNKIDGCCLKISVGRREI
jgi:hypothetical protein